MRDAILLFVNGCLGVFAGMTTLYVAIRLISAVADRIGGGDEGAGGETKGSAP